jgi:uncharacterized damage-inducible protein DinB
MEITNIETFLAYFEKTRQATLKVIDVIPHDKLDWSYMPNKFSIGDLVRHIAAIERHVFAEVVMGNRPTYKGCRKDIVDGYDNVLHYFNLMHAQSMDVFRSIKDDTLKKSIKSLDGSDIMLGNFLRALVIHETHHRAALCIYLNLLGVTTPPILGLMEEQVIQLSK